MRRCVLAFSLILVALPARAAERQPWSWDQARRLVTLSSPRMSPDGRTVVFLLGRPDPEQNRTVTELHAVEVSTGATRALTFERRRVSSPEFSPDGRQLAFLAPDADQRDQVWLLPMAGGDARRLTRSRTGVNQFAWRPDGRAIAFGAPDSAERRTGEQKGVTAFKVEDTDLFLSEPMRPSHIWLQAVDSSDARRLTSGSWSLDFALPPSSPPSRLSWSPDGRHIAYCRVPAPQSGRLDSSRIEILEVATGATRRLDDLERGASEPRFTPDGRGITFLYAREGRSDAGWVSELHVRPVAGGPMRSLTRAIDRQVYGGRWMPDGRSLLVAANDRTTVGLWLLPPTGAPRRLDLGALVMGGSFGYDYAVGGDGAIAFTASTATRPAELYLLTAPGAAPRRLTDFHGWADSLALAQSERVVWRTHDGMEADGVLTLPADFDPARPHPLVLVIHGGPTSTSKANFNSMAQLMAAEGWAVFQPNYRGSDNLGNAFQSAIIGDWGEGPGRDVMAGIESLSRRPGLDTGRMAVTGWSYGGYMTTWLAGRYPGAWKAAMAGAPVTDWAQQYNFSDFGVQLRDRFGGSPWVGDRAAYYRAQSPVAHADSIRVPTLIMSHMQDFRVPPTQALELYRRLKDRGVETEFIGFPGRTHNPTDPANQRERTRLWIDWVRRHIGGDPKGL
jgi:dipeptidyl aminopeptidase/acylaminoacyl peptidase